MFFPVKRFMKFVGINSMAFPANIGTAWLLLQGGAEYHLATMMGYFVHGGIVFTIGRQWIFSETVRKNLNGFIRAFIVEAVSLSILLCAVHVGVEILGLSFIQARLSAVLATSTWDYFGHSSITFGFHPLKK